MLAGHSAQIILFQKDGVSLRAAVPSSDGEGVILTLALNRHAEKNVVNPTMISALVEALDAIDAHPIPADTHNKALIITGLSLDDEGPPAKFFSNGLDLEWMLKANNSNTDEGAKTAKPNLEQGDPTSMMIESFNSLVLARVLTLPFRTIAAINGHCIGAGLFLALACDYRIMRTERGYVQWPEARLGMRLTKGFAELSKAKIGTGRGNASDRSVLREGILVAKKYAPSEALASGIVDAIYPVKELYDRAFQMAKEGLPESTEGMNLEYFDPKGYAEIKMEMYTDAYRALKYGRVGDAPDSRI
ncbi:hypothetical protein ACHAXT_009262 [Thalassiosira profunda]